MKIYNKFKNIKKIINNNYIIIAYDFLSIKKSLINFINKKNNLRIFFLNCKELSFFNFFYKKSINFLIVKNTFSLIIETILLVFNFINKKPLFLLSNNCFIDKIPLKEISKLSKENLIFELINLLKIKFIKLINLLKNYEKLINR